MYVFTLCCSIHDIASPPIQYIRTYINIKKQSKMSLGKTKLQNVSGPPAWSIFCQVITHRQADK